MNEHSIDLVDGILSGYMIQRQLVRRCFLKNIENSILPWETISARERNNGRRCSTELTRAFVGFITFQRHLVRSCHFAFFEKVISGWKAISAKGRQNRMKDVAHLTRSFVAFIRCAQKLNELQSCDFNVIRMFSPGETMHSALIANLLDPRGAHGQGGLFLNLFLDQLHIKNDPGSGSPWVITAEKGRVDILLKRRHPHSVIIIENKSNWAGDQNNQLYRYWHQEIYKAILRFHLPDAYIEDPPSDRYRLIYLVPEHWKKPSEQSLMKPSGWPASLPPKVPLDPECHLFRELIVNWLTAALPLLPMGNSRMREHIKQYIEFWS